MRLPFYLKMGNTVRGNDGTLWATFYVPWWAKPYIAIRRLLIFLLLSVSAFAGVRYDNIVLRDNGRPAASAQIRVCTDASTGFPCTPLASIYSDQALTVPIVGSIITADGLGNFYFYAAPAEYTLEVSGPGIAVTRVYHDIPVGGGGGGGSGTVTSVGISLTNFTCSVSTVTTSGTLTCAPTTPTGTGFLVQRDSPSFTTKIVTPSVEGVEAAAGTTPTGTTWAFRPITAKGWCVIEPVTGTQYCPSQNTSPLSIKAQVYSHNGSINCAVAAPSSDGLVFTSNSASPCGINWQSPSGGGGGTPTAPLPALCMSTATVNFSNTATQHVLHSCSLTTTQTNVLNRVIRMKAQGILSTTTSGPTLNLAVTVAGVVTLAQADFTLAASLAAVGWSIDCDITRSVTGVSGATNVQCTFRVSGTGPTTTQMTIIGTGSGNGPVWDATVTQAIDVRETFGTANAGNSITQKYSNYEQVNQ